MFRWRHECRVHDGERQRSIHLIELDAGTLSLPPVIDGFVGKRGEFYNQGLSKGSAILVRYVWFDLSPKAAHEQSFSDDGGRTWEVNCICALSR